MGSGSLLALVAKVQSFRRNPSHGLQQAGVSMHSMALRGAAPSADDQTHVVSFHAELAQRVAQLQLQGGSAHLNWLLDACACTLSTHASFASTLMPSSSAAAPALNERADEVLSMLDACSSLKQVADDVDRQLDMLQAALLSSRQGCYKMGARQLAADRRLQTRLHGLEAIISSSSPQYRPRAEAQAALLLAASHYGAAPHLSEALDGTLLISLLALASAFATFAAPRTRSSSTSAIHSACKRIAAYTSGKSGSSNTSATWAAPLRQLQRDLKQEHMGASFLELQGLHRSASSIHTNVSSRDQNEDAGELKQRIDRLRKRSQEAQACVASLRSQLAALFQTLLALRLSLLEGRQYCC
ncbi:hypothetical protein L7F22_011073 [Adiantum nelumboides]|nr:hypothetical protein [Adiantum nelumboides]